jgi:hypothetical protein
VGDGVGVCVGVDDVVRVGEEVGVGVAVNVHEMLGDIV